MQFLEHPCVLFDKYANLSFSLVRKWKALFSASTTQQTPRVACIGKHWESMGTPMEFYNHFCRDIPLWIRLMWILFTWSKVRLSAYRVGQDKWTKDWLPFIRILCPNSTKYVLFGNLGFIFKLACSTLIRLSRKQRNPLVLRTLKQSLLGKSRRSIQSAI